MDGAKLVIHLVGQPAVTLGNQSCNLRFRYRKTLGLLAVIALNNGKPLSRDYLSSLFWPELDSSEGRLNLRQLVSDLKRAFMRSCGTFPVRALRSQLCLDVDQTRLDCDLELPDLLVGTERPSATAELSRSLKTLIGSPVLNYELLPGYSLPDCDDFEEWLIVERERFLVRQLAVLQTITEAMLAQGDTLNALAAAQLALKHSPHNETFLITVVRLLEQRGRREAARKACESFINQLEREVGVPPSSELQALYQQLCAPPAVENVPVDAEELLPGSYNRSLIVVLRISWHLGQLDPESFAQRLHQADVIARQFLIPRFQAHRVRGAGRGCFYYFGWPRADQDAAFSALTATCRLQRLLSKEGLGSLASYALHTGQVLTDTCNHIPDLIGDLSEQVVQLARQAEPGQIVLSSPVKAMLADRITAQPLGIVGADSDPGQEAYLLQSVDCTNDLFFSLDSHIRVFARLDQLMQGVRKRKATRIFTLIADAGMGKTASISEWLRRSGHACLKLSCFPDSHCEPLQPLRDLGQELHAGADTPEADFVQSLQRLIAAPEQPQRDEFYSRLGDILQHALADRESDQPPVIWLEDAHWCDLTTLDLLTYLSRSDHFVALIICTGRREFNPPFLTAVRHQLGSLQPDDATFLLQSFQCRESVWLTPPVEQQLISLAGGNPYLLKLLFRQAVDRNAATQEAVISPFVARIDSLGDTARQVAMMAAVVGQNVEVELLQALCRQYHVHLDEQLPNLLEGGVLVRRSRQLLTFEHALLRNALLELTPRSERQEYNLFLAELLSRLQQQGQDYASNRIAQHFCNAGKARKARHIWLQSGLEALEKGVFDAAAHQLESALEAGIRDDLPPRSVLELLLKFAQARSQCFGYGDIKGFEVSLEAAELARTLDGPDNQLQFQALFNAYLGAGATADTPLIKYARMLEQLATSDSQQLVVYWAMSYALFWNGELEESLEWCYRGKAMISNIPPDEYFRFGYQDLRLASTIFTGWNEALLGNRETALAEAESLLDLIPKSDPYNYCHTLFFAAITFYWCGHKERSAELARKCRDIGHRSGFDLWFYAGELLEMATGEFCQGEVDETRIMQLLEGIRQAHNGYALAAWLGVDALEFRQARRSQQRVINRCLKEISSAALGFAQPELLRRRALLNALEGCPRETLARDLRQAETMAEQMKARWHLERIRQTRQELGI